MGTADSSELAIDELETDQGPRAHCEVFSGAFNMDAYQTHQGPDYPGKADILFAPRLTDTIVFTENRMYRGMVMRNGNICDSFGPEEIALAIRNDRQRLSLLLTLYPRKGDEACISPVIEDCVKRGRNGDEGSEAVALLSMPTAIRGHDLEQRIINIVRNGCAEISVKHHRSYKSISIDENDVSKGHKGKFELTRQKDRQSVW